MHSGDIDEQVRVVESLAILDYLEAKYPTPSLQPQEPDAIATMRMVEMVSVTDLQPATMLLTCPLVGLEVDAQKLAVAKQRVATVMQFYTHLLEHSPYFTGEFSCADIVAGSLVPSLPLFGFPLESYPPINAWVERLALRPSWQQTNPSAEVIEAALPSIRAILERRS